MQFFEDIEVGSIAGFGTYAVTREEVIAFAEKYDPQAFHLDDEAAAQTFFGRVAASGWHTCAMTMAMLVAEQDRTGHQGMGSPGIEDLRWLVPVYPGDILRCEREVLGKQRSTSRPGMGIFRCTVTVFNQHDAAVMRFTSAAFVRCRDGQPPQESTPSAR